ncbi:MAG: hypothetical protein GQ532_18905, partial [Methylomarinum sp.]|nr:hypothetical protein [Methylomarinum sp.]
SNNMTFGTIGGGKVEHDLTNLAINCLHIEQYKTQLFQKKHYASATDASGQLCGGKQTVATIICQQSDLPLLQTLQQTDKNNCPVILEVSPDGLKISQMTENISTPFFHYSDQSDWCYKSIIGLVKRAYIIGGGHVSLALTQVLVLLGFEVTVIEQRSAVKSMEDNSLASQKRIMPYTEVGQAVTHAIQAYVFVMTHSHETDQQVIESLAAKNFKYLGVLGSRHKIELMKKNLKAKVSEQNWQSIHAPVGLAINSHTPMEIAISIAAELIQFDNHPKMPK